MSYDINIIDLCIYEGELNKFGFWIFIIVEFVLFGILFVILLIL